MAPEETTLNPFKISQQQLDEAAEVLQLDQATPPSLAVERIACDTARQNG
jgi:hypothetical protein